MTFVKMCRCCPILFCDLLSDIWSCWRLILFGGGNWKEENSKIVSYLFFFCSCWIIYQGSWLGSTEVDFVSWKRKRVYNGRKIGSSIINGRSRNRLNKQTGLKLSWYTPQSTLQRMLWPQRRVSQGALDVFYPHGSGRHTERFSLGEWYD